MVKKNVHRGNRSARGPRFARRGPEFESRTLHHFIEWDVAQLVVRLTVNEDGTGSSPVVPANGELYFQSTKVKPKTKNFK